MDQLNPHVLRAPYPNPYRPPAGLEADDYRRECRGSRGGPAGFGGRRRRRGCHRGADPGPGAETSCHRRDSWHSLANLCRDRGLLLIVDEVYTGPRSHRPVVRVPARGRRFPIFVCVGKALSGTLSDRGPAWGRRKPWKRGRFPKARRSIHRRSLGNPLACAAGVASLGEIQRHRLVERSADEGGRWIGELRETLGRQPGGGWTSGVAD